MSDATHAVKLEDCPIGLFVSAAGSLCLKTEYSNNEGRIDAYIVDSGEFYWGPSPQSVANQRASLVTPVDATGTIALIRCEECEGDGSIDDEECEACDGRGWVQEGSQP